MLQARRLCEAGCAFVTLNYGGWDMHGNIKNAMDQRGPEVDRAVAALVEDLDQRGQLDNTLLVISGEFGRTPKISNRAAREHWNRCYFSIWAGAGIEEGRCIGESDDKANFPVTRPITPLMAGTTIAELAGVGAQQRAELKVLDGGSLIDELL